MATKSVDKGISEIVGALTDPIIVFPGGWGDTLPEWLKNTIILERLTMNMRVLKGELPTGTDAEACAYLYTAALTQPLDHDWGQIYLYIATKTYRHWGKREMPADIAVDKLDDEQMRDLNRLKAWLYQRRTTIRLDRDRAERRQKREEEAAARKEAQPALFDF
ncbi:unnamed protein product [marine sediment metagenome]|uniref:Uncharacterized protein n=1 Tax=marine sediment metagenome TaxID=412755 RepID=X1M6E6_9ZZZZ